MASGILSSAFSLEDLTSRENWRGKWGCTQAPDPSKSHLDTITYEWHGEAHLLSQESGGNCTWLWKKTIKISTNPKDPK